MIDNKKITRCGGRGRRERGTVEEGEHGTFLGSGTILYDSLMVGTWHFAFNKIQRMTQHKK